MVRVVDFRIQVPWRMSETDPPLRTSAEDGQYGELYAMESLYKKTLDDLLTEMEATGVDMGVLHAEYAHGEPEEWNSRVVDAIKRYPEKFIGIGTVDPARGPRAVHEARRCLEDYGFRGINMQPCVSRVPATDPKSYLIYSVALEYGATVTLHTGVNFFRSAPISLGRPADICRVACDLPDLRIVACHGGWPWTAEMAAVAWKHPNVYVEFGAVAPKYVTRPGTGWEVLWGLAHNQLGKQTMFGTDWPLLGYDRALREFEVAGVTPETHRDFFARNCFSALGLPFEDSGES
jgi:predicted TIM-barrel fold metal-dependent hydrolase